MHAHVRATRDEAEHRAEKASDDYPSSTQEVPCGIQSSARPPRCPDAHLSWSEPGQTSRTMDAPRQIGLGRRRRQASPQTMIP
jgi:hypothetical protein